MLGMVAHACNPNTWKTKTGGLQVSIEPLQFSKSLSNLVRSCFKIKINWAWWHTLVIPAFGRLRPEQRIAVRGQPQLLSEVLCNLVRPYFKIKNKKVGWR